MWSRQAVVAITAASRASNSSRIIGLDNEEGLSQ